MLARLLWPIRLLLWWLREAVRRRRPVAACVGFLLEAPPPEPEPAPRPRWQRVLGMGRGPLSIEGLARQLASVTAEPRVRTVVVHLRPMEMAASQVDALRALFADVRAAGVRVVCWASSYTASTYQVACAADEVLLQPGGLLAPLGLARDHVFLADALAHLGLRVDLLQVSPYKTAGDPLTRRGLTPEAREMADWLADAAYAQRVAAIAQGRGLAWPAARDVVERSPLIDDQALAAGAVDAVVAEEDLPARLGGEVRPYAAARRRLARPRPPRPGRVVALLRIEGLIVDGRSRQAPFQLPLAPPLLFREQCGDLTVVEQARALAMDRRVGAVVVWVDSGGGSASASEAMASALAALRRRKPVVAAMGSVAASGGYYVTASASRVFAHPGTVTGSIGVLAGKLVAGRLLDRLRIAREQIVRGEHSAMWGMEQPFSDVERGKVGDLVDRSYRLFLERVTAARGRPVEEVEPVAGGRVWTGSQALERGLVDELGGLRAAVAEARRLGGLPDDAEVRDVRRGRRELVPEPAPAAALEHALRALATLRGAGVWWLCPLVIEDGG